MTTKYVVLANRPECSSVPANSFLAGCYPSAGGDVASFLSTNLTWDIGILYLVVLSSCYIRSGRVEVASSLT